MAFEEKIKALRLPHPVLLLIIILQLIPAAALASAGFIESLNGTVYLRASSTGRWAPASVGSEVSKGSSVRTAPDGRASLRLKDGSRLSIGNSTELAISEFILGGKKRAATYYLSTGKMRAIVGKFSGSSDIKVKTPTAIAGVKGTDFIVMNRGPANVLFGESDDVAVRGDAGAPVILAPGDMTENTRGAGPITPVTVSPGSALEEARRELETLTDMTAPAVFEKTERLPEILSRWNINYGHYLADSRRFSEALDVFRIAIDLTELPGARAEAHLERGTVYSRNLNEPGKALTEYMEVVEKYPEDPFAENALFSAGMIEMELGEKEKALGLFKRYLSVYPEGSHRETVLLFIKTLEGR